MALEDSLRDFVGEKAIKLFEICPEKEKKAFDYLYFFSDIYYNKGIRIISEYIVRAASNGTVTLENVPSQRRDGSAMRQSDLFDDTLHHLKQCGYVKSAGIFLEEIRKLHFGYKKPHLAIGSIEQFRLEDMDLSRLQSLHSRLVVPDSHPSAEYIKIFRQYRNAWIDFYDKLSLIQSQKNNG
jgi:hypothetical protein